MKVPIKIPIASNNGCFIISFIYVVSNEFKTKYSEIIVIID